MHPVCSTVLKKLLVVFSEGANKADTIYVVKVADPLSPLVPLPANNDDANVETLEFK